MHCRGTARKITAVLLVLAALPALAHAATYTTPRQLALNDVYQLNPDSATGDEATTEPKTDLNDGLNGDNAYFQRVNVARAHLGGCDVNERYWYTSSYQEAGEPDPNGAQYVDYIPPFGTGANQLTPGRYQITGRYRNTTSRANYPAEYIVHHANGTTTVLKSQLDGTSGGCNDFDIGSFDLSAGSYVRVNDSGGSSITFNRMKFTYLGPLGGVPYVSAGADQTIVQPAAVTLDGTAVDPDGQPAPLAVTWSKVSGPGTVTFADPGAVDTTATFSIDGTYVLRLTASDTVNSPSDDITVTVLPAGSCQLDVSPTCGTGRQPSSFTFSRAYCMAYPTATIPPMEFVLRNLGATPITYTVTEITSATNLTAKDYAWLVVANPTGTIPANGSVTVVATIDPSGLALPDAADADGALTNNGYLAFAEGTCGLAVITRFINVTALRADATSVHIYQGDMDPTVDGSGGSPGRSFYVQEGTNQGYVEDDPDAVDGKAWRIVDGASTKTKFRAVGADPIPDPLVFTRSGATVVGRVKVRSHTDPRGGALIFWDSHLSAEYHWGDNGSDGVITEINRGGTTLLTNGFDQKYHILRMTGIGDATCNRVIKLYFDEDVSPVAVLTIPSASAISSSYDGIGFGAGSTAGSYDVSFDWVSLTNAGAFAPGEEQAVIGRSLVLGRTCPTPWVDWDQDGDVDMQDFAGLQLCVNGMSEPWAAMLKGCECFDNANPRGRIDEFDVNYFARCASGPTIPWAPTVNCPN